MAINVDISKITGINQVGNSYQRKSAVPLDYFSLFNTKAEAVAYAASNPVSYVGQVISYIDDTDNGKVKVCVIADTAGTLREVGTKPVGDGYSIEVSADGAISLKGLQDATDKLLPRANKVIDVAADPENGIEEQSHMEIEWVSVDAVVQGDGNTKAVVIGGDNVTVNEYYQGSATDTWEYTVNVDLSELESGIEELSGDITALKDVIGDAIPSVSFDPSDYDCFEEGDLNLFAGIDASEYYSSVFVLGSVGEVEYEIPGESDSGLRYDTINGLGSSCFEVMTQTLEALYLPETIRYIDEFAFLGCSKLTDIYFMGNASQGEWELIEGFEYIPEGVNLHFEVNSDENTVFGQLGLKANKSDVYTKNEVDNAIAALNIGNYATTQYVNAELAKKANDKDLTDLANKVDAFLTGTGTEDALDSLQELINYIETHDDVDIAGILENIQVIEKKLTLGTYVDGEETKEYATVKAYVEAVIEALNMAQYAKQADLNGATDRIGVLEGRANGVDTKLAGIEGTVKKYVDDAVDVVRGIAEDAQTEGEVQTAIGEALKAYSTTDDIDKDYAKKATTLEGYGIADAYTATETDNAIAAKIKEMTGGESAADVLLALNNYKAANDREVWGDEFVTNNTVDGKYTPNYSGNSRIDDLKSKVDGIEAGAEVNIIETVKVNGEALTPDANRAVDITVPREIANLTDGNTFKLAVSNNTQDIDALKTQIHGGTVEGQAVKGIISRLAAVETEVGVVEASRIDSLEGIIGNEDGGLVKTVAGHTSELSTLKNQTLVSMQQEINGKVAQGTFDALNAKVDTGDKKVSVYVADEIAKIPAYDDTAVKKLISDEADRAGKAEAANKTAIEAIYKAGEGEAAATGLLAEEIARAKAAEKANADDINEINALLNTISDTDDITSLKELALWVQDHETEVLPVIEQQGKDIDALELKVNTGDKDVATYVADAIADIPMATATTLGLVKSATDVEGKVAVNKIYVDTDGVGEVKAIGVDKLVNVEGFELILNGGNASLA